MSQAEATSRIPVDRGVACRAWYAVLTLVITASLITQVVLLVSGGTDANSASGEASVGLAVRFVRWLLFGPRPQLDWATLGWMLVWPLLWIAYTFAHGAATGWYPYPFLNAHLHGYSQALGSTAAVVVLALVIAVILRFADRRLPVITR